jgi:PUB domain
MGFDAVNARNALAQTNGDVDDAAVLLLRQPSQPSHHVPFSDNMDQAMRNAIEESLQTEDQRLYRQAQEASLQRPRAVQPKKNTTSATTGTPNRPTTAAATKSGQAAASRASNPTNRSRNDRSPIHEHHPNVKIPSKLEDKSKEEQILRNVNRVKGYPTAVDTLYKALTALRTDPNNQKFRRIDKSNPGYQRSLASAPGAEALLLVMNFTQIGNTLVLERSRVDPALLFLGISALEDAQKSSEYQDAKRQIQFEALMRANFISKCPSEPPGGRGALVQVGFGDETIKRRFDGDDVLQDVVNWLGGHGSAIPDKLLTREWCLVDKNRFPISPIDIKVNLDKTLQYVGFWPSGKLEIRPSPMSWLDGTGNTTFLGSSRGLGAAPSDTLQ